MACAVVKKKNASANLMCANIREPVMCGGGFYECVRSECERNSKKMRD